ncbi:cytochrome c-552 precursor [Ferrovum sp. PN-J185]|nr:cytochrome c-552 precursor [Ferrovum sp. PN-J185]
MNKNKFVFISIGLIILFILITNMMHSHLVRSGMMLNRPSMQKEALVKTSHIFVDAQVSEELTSYINNNHLPCLQCHEINTNKVGPAYVTIAQKYIGKENANLILASHIANGYGAMPGELANTLQANDLANLIIRITKNMAEK